MREHEEDTTQKVKTYDKGIQDAWNMMSMHNSELLLENYQLKERIDSMTVLGLIKLRVLNFFWGKFYE